MRLIAQPQAARFVANHFKLSYCGSVRGADVQQQLPRGGGVLSLLTTVSPLCAANPFAGEVTPKMKRLTCTSCVTKRPGPNG